jgi:hypothetical protein
VYAASSFLPCFHPDASCAAGGGRTRGHRLPRCRRSAGGRKAGRLAVKGRPATSLVRSAKTPPGFLTPSCAKGSRLVSPSSCMRSSSPPDITNGQWLWSLPLNPNSKSDPCDPQKLESDSEKGARGRQCVLVMESSEDRIGAHDVGFSAAMARSQSGNRDDGGIGNPRTQPHMGPSAIVMLDPRAKGGSQLSFR